MNDPLRIIRVQVDELDPGPLPTPFQDSTMGPFTHWKLTWLRLTADDGRIGQAPANVPEPVARALVSEGPRTLEQWWRRIFWVLRNNGHRSPATSGAIYGIDLAMRDILSQRARKPWHRFMGATRDVVPVYACGGGTNLSIDELLAEMKSFVSRGFRTVKMKVGKDFGTSTDEDVERVRAVREVIGDRVELAVDANQTWSAEQAIEFARRVAPLDIAWFEEPVQSADRHALREVCSASPIPVAMGESENHWLGFRDLAECGVRHFQPSPHCLPGYDRWRDALAFAESQSAVWSAGGFTHLTAMYVATRAGGVVEYLEAIIGHFATLLSRKPTIADGAMRLADTPGISVEVDWDALGARNAVRSILDVKA